VPARLGRAVELAGALGLRLKLFDAFRPSEAQWVLWNKFPDPEFLADPRRGSPHSRGVAVDLTLVEAGGAELDMGTGFDCFDARSHTLSGAISAEQKRARATLRMHRDVQVPAGARFQPATSGLIGERYLAITPLQADAPALAPGADRCSALPSRAGRQPVRR